MKRIKRKNTVGLLIVFLLVGSILSGCNQVTEETEVSSNVSTETETSDVNSTDSTEMDSTVEEGAGTTSVATVKDTTDGLDEEGNPVGAEISIYTFDTVPVEVVREPIASFTLPTGELHEYEVVYVEEKGLNWVQAKALAEEAGGYLATITSEEENEFVFGLIEDEKYWFKWDDSHNYVMSGPLLGGYQPVNSGEPNDNWKWVTGEPFTFTAWCVDGVPEDEDPRPNNQPNDATGNQNILAYGEINAPVSYWGDFPHRFGSYNDTHEGQAHAFIIEYGEY